MDISEQELVDCSQRYGNEGCDGGWMLSSFDYIKIKGISKLTDYPYIDGEQECKLSPDNINSANITITDYNFLGGTENDLKKAVGE